MMDWVRDADVSLHHNTILNVSIFGIWNEKLDVTPSDTDAKCKIRTYSNVLMQFPSHALVDASLCAEIDGV